jgi:acetyl esterase/lipase
MNRIGWTLTTTLLGLAVSAADPVVLPVWPNRDAGTLESDEKVKDLRKDAVSRFISNVKWPTMTVHLPDPDKATGAAVVICPGGGYGGVAIDLEGHDVAKWLNTLGVAGIVLKYRMPRPAESKDELQVTAQTPPTFLIHAKDDPVKVDNSLLFAEALKKAGVPHKLQLYDKGGHGYGLGIHGGEVAQWPARCAEWMKELKLVR